MEYIYLVKEREFIKTEEEIYKIGRSAQYNAKRINQYPNGSIILLIIFCGNSEEIEKFLITEFKKLFKQRRDIGLEYFEGCFLKMRDVITENIIKLDNITIDKFKKETRDELNKRIQNIESQISERKKRNDEQDELKNKVIDKEIDKEELKRNKEERKKKKEERKKKKEEKKREKEEKKREKEEEMKKKEEELILKKEEKKREKEEKKREKEEEMKKKEEELILKKEEKKREKEEKCVLKKENNENIIKDFLNYFELSDNINDYILSSEIQEWLNEKNIGISMKKFGMEMKKYIIINNLKNIKNDAKSINGKSKQVWIGIKYMSDYKFSKK